MYCAPIQEPGGEWAVERELQPVEGGARAARFDVDTPELRQRPPARQRIDQVDVVAIEHVVPWLPTYPICVTRRHGSACWTDTL